jgi:CubicO group peptidase (beta-lactamase class C family)
MPVDLIVGGGIGGIICLKYARVIAMLFLLPGFQSATADDAAGEPATRHDVRAFVGELEALRAAHQIPGLAAAVVRDRELVLAEGFGMAWLDDGVPVTPDTPFWIASLTKPFVALLYLQLEDDGAVDLDDRISEVPGWGEFCPWLRDSGIVFGRDLRCDAPITLEDILHHTVNGEPGSRFLYNPLMYSRLSRYLEHREGNPVSWVEGRQNTLAQLVQARILGPASMSRTMSSQWQREKALVFFDMAQGYDIENNRFVRRPRPERELAGGAGIVSTVLDLGRFDLALDSGALASKAVMAKLFEPALALDGTSLPYAWGWFVQVHRGERLVWHSGWDEEAGFSALYLKVPERRLTLILLANSEGLWWGNPLDRAEVEKSPFARAFLDRFAFDTAGPGGGRKAHP